MRVLVPFDDMHRILNAMLLSKILQEWMRTVGSGHPVKVFLALLQALRKIMEACGQSFQPHLTPELRALLYKAIRHPNRFVRETSYHVLATVCTLSAGPNLKQFGGEVAECLQDGLSENWSQVH